MKIKPFLMILVLTAILSAGCSQVAKEAGLEPETPSMVDQEKTVQLSSLVVNPQDNWVKVGGKIQFRVSPYYGDTEIVLLGINASWETNSQIGSITSAGLFTALAEGTCEVKATIQNLTATSRVTIIPSHNPTPSQDLSRETKDNINLIPENETPPDIPKNLSATAGNSFITLNWESNAGDNLKFYRLYRKSENESSFTAIATTAAAAYVDADLTNNIIYSYKITAVDTSGNESNFSNSASMLFKDKIPPSPPQNLAGTVSNSSVTLSWDKNSEADFAFYQLYRKAGPDSSFTAATTTASNSYQDSNLTNNTTYTYKLKSIDNVGNEGEFSSELSLTPQDLDVPQAPTGLKATAKDSSVILSWRANSEADLKGYKLYRRLSDSDNFESVATLNKVTSYQDKNLTNDLVYEYALSAIDTSLNESQLSSNVSTAPKDMTPPAAPTGLNAATGITFVDLSWTANTESDIAGYNIYRMDSPFMLERPESMEELENRKINISLIANTSFKDTSINEGTYYGYKVTAVDKNLNESAMSEWVEIQTLLAPPDAPTSLGVEISNDQITLFWEVNDWTWDDIYIIERRDNNNQITTQESPYRYFMDYEVESGKTYYYRVATRNEWQGQSEFSEEISASLIVPEE